MGFVERLGIESKSLLCLDVPTRWNFTYLMLETAQKFEKVFIQMDFEDDSYSSYFMNKENSGGMGSFSGIDLQNCRTFVGLYIIPLRHGRMHMWLDLDLTWNGCEQRKRKCWLKDPILGLCQRRDCLKKEVRYVLDMVLKHSQKGR